MSEGAAGFGARRPFLVLGVSPSASAREVERAGQRLLAQLQVGAASATHFMVDGQRVPRTVEDVREALALLRDPDRRLGAELEAQAEPGPALYEPGVDLWDGLDAGCTRPWEAVPRRGYSWGR